MTLARRYLNTINRRIIDLNEGGLFDFFRGLFISPSTRAAAAAHDANRRFCQPNIGDAKALCELCDRRKPNEVEEFFCLFSVGNPARRDALSGRLSADFAETNPSQQRRTVSL